MRRDKTLHRSTGLLSRSLESKLMKQASPQSQLLPHSAPSIAGVTLVELMVSLAIGSFLMIGAMQIYSNSRQAHVINDSMARVMETAQFAMDTIEADIRMASNYGQSSRGDAVEGASQPGDANPKGLAVPTPNCGNDWAFNLNQPFQGTNNAYPLACAAVGVGGAQAGSDVVTIRRASIAPVALEAGRLQIQSTRIQGEIIDDGARPPEFDAVTSRTHNLVVNSYYVAANSTLIPGVPTLRRKTLDEIAMDGVRFGTHKLIPLKTRFQGRDAAGHQDLLRRRTRETVNGRTVQSEKYVNNFLNFRVENFQVKEEGSLQDIITFEEQSFDIQDDDTSAQESAFDFLNTNA